MALMRAGASFFKRGEALKLQTKYSPFELKQIDPPAIKFQ